MVTTKKTIKTNNKVQSARLKQSKKLSWKLVLPFVALAAVAGVYFVFTSKASTSAGTVATRSIGFDISHTTGSVKSSDGWLCVATTFNNEGWGGAARNTYKWDVETYKGYQWTKVATSKSYTANSNRDHECYDAGIYKGNTYRVRFFNTTKNGSTSGSYYVSGFYRK